MHAVRACMYAPMLGAYMHARSHTVLYAIALYGNVVGGTEGYKSLRVGVA